MSPPSTKPPSLLRNPLSLLGIMATVIATAFGLPMMILDIFRPHASPYVAVLIYLVLPMAAAAGVGVAGIGALWERRRRNRRPGVPIREQSFQHPLDLGMDVSELCCSDCHTGTSGL